MGPHAFSLPGTQGRRLSWPAPSELTSKIRSAGPALLFGLRLWAAVCLALYIAFWLGPRHGAWGGPSGAVRLSPKPGRSAPQGLFRHDRQNSRRSAIVILTA